MEIIGFADVLRTSAKATTYLRSDLHILDLDLDGNPRKGEESMFVEARKQESKKARKQESKKARMIVSLMQYKNSSSL